MLAAQIHRGPDDSGEELIPLGDSTLALGARRLAVIDVSPAGHQPMIHPDTGDCLVFSGEIYDFRSLRKELEGSGVVFRGQSDTEVLLHALVVWGPDCLARLNGMFALAFFDRRRGSLLLARDALGIRPLYVAAAPGVFLFANEVRAILASDLIRRSLDPTGVAGMVALGAVQDPNTLFESVRAFPPGCYQSCSLGAWRDGRPVPMRRLWKYPALQPRVSGADAIATVGAKLESAVRDHLVSDVPMGIFLSSGIDSAVVGGLAARSGVTVRAFTLGFPDVPELSEVSSAQETASLAGADHTAIQITGEEAVAAASEWLESLDQPSADGLNTYMVARAARQHGITVALSGLGGDELFGGYSTFVHIPIANRLRAGFSRLPTSMGRGLTSLATRGQSEVVRFKAHDMLCTKGDVLDLYLLRRQELSNRQLSKLGIDAARIRSLAHTHLAQACPDLPLDDSDIVRTVACLETRLYLLNTLLRDGDCSCMACSLELRVPMLDRRIIDYVLSLPGRILLPERKANKHLLRSAFSQLIPSRVLTQKKRGFMLPISRWMLGPLRELCETGLSDLKSSGTLASEGVDEVWRSFLAAPHSQMWSRAFTLCVLGVYLGRMQRQPQSRDPLYSRSFPRACATNGSRKAS